MSNGITSPLTTLAAAKINLTLAVHGRRPDGYHELESLVAFADVGDNVRLESADDLAVAVTGPFASAIDGENLVAKAARLVREAAPTARLGRFTIDKQLPVAAGLGGGSADAAAALRLLRRANPALAGLDWHAIALRLGADVPVCLAQRPAIMRGTGDEVPPLSAPLPPVALVLVNALQPVPAAKTAAVFRALAAPPLEGAAPRPTPLPPLATSADLARLVRNRGNALAAPARSLMPSIAAAEAALAANPACLAASLSGAGPTCFGLFADLAAARAAAERIGAAKPGWWVATARLLNLPEPD